MQVLESPEEAAKMTTRARAMFEGVGSRLKDMYLELSHGKAVDGVPMAVFAEIAIDECMSVPESPKEIPLTAEQVKPALKKAIPDFQKFPETAQREIATAIVAEARKPSFRSNQDFMIGGFMTERGAEYVLRIATKRNVKVTERILVIAGVETDREKKLREEKQKILETTSRKWKNGGK